jgi:hypothetical protein
MFYRDRDAFLYHGRFLLRVADLMRACTFKKTGRQEFFQDILSFDQGYASLDKNSCPVWYYCACDRLRTRPNFHIAPNMRVVAASFFSSRPCLKNFRYKKP